MAKRDNDKTKNIARPALIVAAIRSGGTFLSHCLSNHTRIFCDRGEPLHHLSVWCQTLKVDRTKILAALLNQTGYEVSVCRLTYVQAFHKDIWPWIVEKKPAIIWLRRENLLRQATSVHLNRLVRDKQAIKRPAHTFSPARPVSVEIKPGHFLKMCRGLEERNRWAEKRLATIGNVCWVTYSEVVNGDKQDTNANQLPWRTAMRICGFLDVPHEPMGCHLQRVNPYALSELISNWAEVAEAIKSSEFAHLLEAGG